MSCQKSTCTEHREVGVSMAQANGTQGLIPLTVIKISTRIITGDVEQRVEKRKINLILGEQYTSEV